MWVKRWSTPLVTGDASDKEPEPRHRHRPRPVRCRAPCVPANTQAVYEETVPTGTTDHEIDLGTTVATNLVQALHSTQAVTVVSNIPSTSTATTAHQTIAVAKNVAQVWTTNEPTAGRVFTVDVVKLYVTNSSGSDAKVQIGFASDDTP